MDDSMVTARMSAEKKQRGANILSRDNLSASQAINLMYDRMVEEGQTSFLLAGDVQPCDDAKWAAAAHFVDTLSSKRSSEFDDMTKAEVRRDRLHAKGLI